MCLRSMIILEGSAKMVLLWAVEAAMGGAVVVSEAVAVLVVGGVRVAVGTTVGVSTTGIAGPTGGTPDKPVGTVWVGYADASERHARRHQFVEDRTLNKELFASAALEEARRTLSA